MQRIGKNIWSKFLDTKFLIIRKTLITNIIKIKIYWGSLIKLKKDWKIKNLTKDIIKENIFVL